MSEFVKVAAVHDLSPGQGKCVEVGGKKIAVFQVNGSYYAVDDTCPHKEGPLSEGEVDGGEVICPWHGARFNLESGSVTGGPATNGIKSYRVKVEGDDLKVEV